MRVRPSQIGLVLFYKREPREPRPFSGEKGSLSNVAGTPDTHMQKDEVGALPYTVYKI